MGLTAAGLRVLAARVVDWLGRVLLGSECDDTCTCEVCAWERRGITW